MNIQLILSHLNITISNKQSEYLIIPFSTTFRYVTIWAKISHVCIQTEIHLLPQLIATLNNYACSLPPLVNANWSASQECFFRSVNPWLVKWHPRRAPIWQWEPDIYPTVSTRLSRLCSGILTHCGYMWRS